MKRLFFSCVGMAVLMAATSVEASIKISLNSNNLIDNQTKVSFVTGAVDPSGGNSGFLGTIWNSAGTQVLEQWETFCVEAGGASSTEFINLDNRKYTMQSTTASNPSATNNFVTNAAKWVYYAFGRGLLTGWVADDGEEVQEAIWSLVEANGAGGANLATATGDALTWRDQAIAAVATAEGLAQANRIRIINPVTVDSSGNVTQNNQSMLYEIPEASTMALWSVFSLVGLGVYRRRSQK